MEQKPDYPRFSQALVLLLLWILLQFVFAIPLLIAGLFRVSVPLVLAGAVVNFLGISGVLAFGLWRSKASFKEVFPLTGVRLSLFLPMALTVLGLSIVVSELGNLLRIVAPMPQWLSQFFSSLMNQQSIWSSALLLVVVAPFTEEFLFRGLMLRGFLRNYGLKTAIFLSALLFGIFHLNPWQFVGALILGSVFAWWFVRTRSLIPCLFGHGLNNALPLIYGPLLNLEIQGYTKVSAGRVEFQPLWFDLLGLLLAAAGVWLLMKMFAESEKSPAEEPLAEQIK